MTSATQNETTTDESIPSLEDILSAPLKKTGSDIPDGSYAATLYGFSEPFYVPTAEQFRRQGQPDKSLRIEMQFAVKTKDGLQSVEFLVAMPEGGHVNQKSNLFKALKAMRGSDPKFMTKEGNMVPGVNLKSFIGSPATVQVSHNKKEFPKVDAVASPIDGMVCPTLKECKALTPVTE